MKFKARKNKIPQNKAAMISKLKKKDNEKINKKLGEKNTEKKDNVKTRRKEGNRQMEVKRKKASK